MTATLDVEVGALWRRAVRNLVAEARFRGHKVDMHESKSFLESRFLIRGDDKAVLAIQGALRRAAEAQ